MSHYGPRAQARDERARQEAHDRGELSLLTLGITAAICVLVIGCLLGKWLQEVPL
jgi:hypothetical protein